MLKSVQIVYILYIILYKVYVYYYSSSITLYIVFI